MKLEVGKYYKTRNGDKVFLREAEDEGCSGFGEPYGLYLPDGKFGYIENGRHLGACPDLDIIAEWTDTPEVGTLKEIGAQPGDRVECVDITGAGGSLGLGDEYEIAQSGLVIDAQGEEYDWIAPKFRIISRAQTGPVRTVTRHEIVPGVYGKVRVHPCGDYTIDQCNADELTDAIQTLTAIRDAMQTNTTA